MTFSGTVSSDFLKLVEVDEALKTSLIDYTATDFTSLKQKLIDYIKAVYPLEYNNFIEGDFGIMLLELIAYIGATTSMKADYLANENYLRTARNKNNVKKLLELIGVRLKGPISAAANALLTFDSAPLSGGEELEIAFANRVIQISSPEDNQPLNFTLYKVVDGLVDILNSDASIILSLNDSDSGLGLSFQNLVLLEGALAKKTGSFSQSQGIKTISLDVSPIVEGSIQVLIEGNSSTSGIYTQVDNIYFASGASNKVFQVITDDNFKGTIVFGDNIIGTSPSPGDDYVVTYRVGGGTRGNIAKEVINAPLTTTNITTSTSYQGTIENISIGTGGSDAETVEHAKKYAPLTFRRQDRVVTLQDYKTFANTFITSYGSIGKATATVRRAFCSANIIDLYILEKASNTQLRKATPMFKKELLEAVDLKKMLTDEVIVVDGLIRTLDLAITVRIDKELKVNEEIIKLQVRDTLLDYFSVDNRDFGQELNPQEVAKVVFSLPMIRYATVDNFNSTIQVDFNEIVQLNNLLINIVRV